MSDHHDAPDPMDKAYAQAEAMLSDEAARAARRARVLGAVAAEPVTAAATSAPSNGKSAWWAPGGWLVAASVAGLSVLIAVEALPLEQRGVFVMFADSGLSLEEIAGVTGAARETVKSRLRYARDKLRQALAGERSTHV